LRNSENGTLETHLMKIVKCSDNLFDIDDFMNKMEITPHWRVRLLFIQAGSFVSAPRKCEG
jgi:hypothetical protein